MTKKPTILIGVTGSIAAYKACEVITTLRKDGYEVIAVMTEDAKEFITPLTIQTLTGNTVYAEMFVLPTEHSPVHTSLADRAGLILIVPATANIIGKLAGGICDDLLTCTMLASTAPVLIAPAMNEKMYRHPVVRENIEKLKKAGYSFVGPIKGRLACGHDAIGHIAALSDIVREAKRLAR